MNCALSGVPALDAFVKRFNRRARELVLDAEVATSGTIRTIITHGAQLNSPMIIDAVKDFEHRRVSAVAEAAAREETTRDRMEAAELIRIWAPIRCLTKASHNSTSRVREKLASKVATARRGQKDVLIFEWMCGGH